MIITEVHLLVTTYFRFFIFISKRHLKYIEYINRERIPCHFQSVDILVLKVQMSLSIDVLILKSIGVLFKLFNY